MSNVKLKPCPFCGGVAKVTEDNTIENIPQYQIRCKNISCTIRPKTNWCIDKTEALTHWNTRKPIDDIVAKLEEMKNECRRLQKTTTDAYGYMKMKQGIIATIDIVKRGGV